MMKKMLRLITCTCSMYNVFKNSMLPINSNHSFTHTCMYVCIRYILQSNVKRLLLNIFIFQHIIQSFINSLN